MEHCGPPRSIVTPHRTLPGNVKHDRNTRWSALQSIKGEKRKKMMLYKKQGDGD